MSVNCPRRVVVYTDHRNEKYFQHIKIINHHKGTWAKLLSESNSVIIHCHRQKNGKAHALPLWTRLALEGGDIPQISMFEPGQMAPLGLSNSRVMRITALTDSDKVLLTYGMCVPAKERKFFFFL